MRAGNTWAIALLVILATVFASGTAAAQDGAAGTEVEIQVDGSGDATWTITNTVTLDTASEREAFQRVSDNRARRMSLGEGVAGQFQAFADRANDRLDRSMTVELTSVEASREGDTGTVTVTLDWTGFAVVDESTGNITVSDVFEGGLSLDEGQSVIVTAPDGYTVADSNAPEGDVGESSVTWTGPLDVQEDVSVTFAESDGEGDGEDGSGEGDQGMPGFSAVAALLAVSLVAYTLRD